MTSKGVTPLLTIARRKLRIRNPYIREALGEFLGTAILLFFVVGGHFETHFSPSNNSLHGVLGILFGLNTAILIAGGASAQVNPAVTLGIAIAGFISWKKVPVLILSQFLGAYVGSGMAVVLYWWGKEGDFTATFPVQVFAPVLHTPLGYAFLDQIVGTGLLVMVIVACVDPRNMKVPHYMIGFYICLTIVGLASCFGIAAGAVLNPARDLSARLMALTMGYPSDEVMIVDGKQWWTVGLFATLLGGCLGSILYILMIGAHLDDLPTVEQPSAPTPERGGPALKAENKSNYE